MNAKNKHQLHEFLNFDLSKEASENFKKSDTYASFSSILDLMDHAKAIDFNAGAALKQLHAKKSEHLPSSNPVVSIFRKRHIIAIAASLLLIIGISTLYILLPKNHYETDVAEHTLFTLPDTSQVWLNADSELEHTANWGKSRNIILKGEAYFEVSKGKTFQVNTAAGHVTVLGTKFNVKQRDNIFEVHCYEGEVLVNYKNQSTILKANTYFSSSINSNETQVFHNKGTKPLWIQRESVFKNTPLYLVTMDIALQYGITFDIDKRININMAYTGQYHYDEPLESVLTILCASLNLNYSINGKIILLEK